MPATNLVGEVNLPVARLHPRLSEDHFIVISRNGSWGNRMSPRTRYCDLS